MQRNSYFVAIVVATLAISLSGVAEAQGRGNGNGGGNGGGGKPPKDDGPFMIVDLGTLGGDSSRANDINQFNNIAGGSYNAADTLVAVIWTLDADGAVVSVEELPPLSAGQNCSATAINDQRDVVGFCVAAEDDFRAVLWERNFDSVMMHDLEDVYGIDFTVYDMNNGGTITANRSFIDADGNHFFFPYLLDIGLPALLLPEPLAYAFGLNDHGTVAGQSPGIGEVDLRDPLLVENGSVLVLDKPVGGFGWAEAINNDGIAVGGAGVHGSYRHAALWARDSYGIYVLEDLGTLGGDDAWASDVNSLGQVVGRSMTSKKRDKHHFAFFRDGVNMINLGALKNFEHLSEARAINDSSIIVGVSGNASHVTRAVAWVPKP